MITYEERLNRDRRWALSEGSRYFEGHGQVREALERITTRLSDLGISYAVAGGMALFEHGYRRFTEDVDIIVSPEGLTRLHAALDGLGYVPPFPNSKHLRDTRSGVRIEFLISGEFPGDGKPKPIAFPDPGEAAIERDGIRYTGLQKLIELKIASGMTNPSRLRDLADVIELIKLLDLREEYRDELHPYVREKFTELWSAARFDQGT